KIRRQLAAGTSVQADDGQGDARTEAGGMDAGGEGRAGERRGGGMILPDGYSDVPAGKIATVVTHLQMTERPALPSDPPGDWSLRRVEKPALDWYRDLYRRVGEEWLWFSRTQVADAELAAIIQTPLVEV